MLMIAHLRLLARLWLEAGLQKSVHSIDCVQGSSITLSTKNGEKYEGVLAGMAFTAGNTKISTKMTKKVQHPESSTVNGAVSREAALVGTSPEYAMTFDMRDVIDVILFDLSLAETAKMANGMRMFSHHSPLG
jgi:hypothetical protein